MTASASASIWLAPYKVTARSLAPMSAPNGYRLVDVIPDRFDERMDVNEWGFAFALPPEARQSSIASYPWERARGIEVADAQNGPVGQLAATHASFETPLRVPGGGEVAAAGLSWVSVHPAHRRRGLLRAMIVDHFSRSLKRKEFVSILYASESQIYQRYGYGHAGHALTVDLGRRPTLREVSGADALVAHLENADPTTHAPIIHAVQSRMTRPGTITRPDKFLTGEILTDIPQSRDHPERLRIAFVEDEHGPAAWATFSRRISWENGQPKGTVYVQAWGAATAPATHRLVSLITDLDLMVSCKVPRVAVDDPLLHLLEDQRPSMNAVDNLWVRVLDVGNALKGRGFAGATDVTLAVTDATLPANDGIWRLQTDEAGQLTTCERTGDRGSGPADIELGIQELSAAYLGGVTLSALGNAGLVTENTAGKLEQFSRVFAGTHAVSCNLDF